ncbi:methyltransferase domain-containing protein [bacterium]|nr:methyltransferase domain-containing protein [bacterium]
MSNVVELICPTCKSILHSSDTELRCIICNKYYPIIDGIPSFTDRDRFYEGRFLHTRRLRKDAFSKLISRFRIVFPDIGYYRQRFLKKCFDNKRGIVLDLGCGGGNELLTTIGPVVGIDLSLLSLQGARNIYNQVVHANATELPFNDETFDYIISLDLLGHIPIQYKNAFISEVYRVLKRGGETVHYIETDSRHPLFQFAKKTPELFQKYFIESVGGHYGLEYPSDVIARFRNSGFKSIYEQGAWGFFWPLEAYVNFFDNEYRKQSEIIDMMVMISKAFRNNRALKIVADCAMGICSKLISPFMNLDYRQGILCCYRK